MLLLRLIPFVLLVRVLPLTNMPVLIVLLVLLKTVVLLPRLLLYVMLVKVLPLMPILILLLLLVLHKIVQLLLTGLMPLVSPVMLQDTKPMLLPLLV